MTIDLCALTEDILPLFAEDLLSPATRQLVLDHAAVCPTCRERLEAAMAPVASPPPPDAPLDKPARRFFGRLRRILLYGLVGVVALLVGAGSLGYAVGRKSPWEKQLIPAHVNSPEEVAAKAIPGWERAEALGLVVDLDITEQIPGTKATITFDKAWYSGRQAYILYTVKAPADGYVLPTRVFLGKEDSKVPWTEGGTDWNHLNTWGGFSPAGFHSVVIFPNFSVPEDAQRLKLTVRQWAPVSAKSGLIQGQSSYDQVSVLIPWQAIYKQEPAPVSVPWSQQHTWMGRTLALEQLQVGIGRTLLTGEISLPAGERDPSLAARLVIGQQALDLKAFKADPTGGPGRYRFTATFDGPNQWPAPVKLELSGIVFNTDQALEWPVNWAKYRDMDGSSRRLMDAADQVTVHFYDSDLTSILAARSGVSIEQTDPKQAPPYVRANIGGGGRIETGPGMEVVNAAGEVLTNIGGGAGVIYDNPQGHDQRQGVAALWWDGLPDNFRQSDRLIIRYVQPAAVLVLKETWELPKEP